MPWTSKSFGDIDLTVVGGGEEGDGNGVRYSCFVGDSETPSDRPLTPTVSFPTPPALTSRVRPVLFEKPNFLGSDPRLYVFVQTTCYTPAASVRGHTFRFEVVEGRHSGTRSVNLRASEPRQ